MRKIKLFLIGVLLLLAFLYLITLFLPSKITVSKSILIDAAENIVRKQIENFNNWKNWYPAFKDKSVIIKIQDSSFARITDENQRTVAMRISNDQNKNVSVVLSGDSKSGVNYQFILAPNGKDKTLLIWNINTNLAWYSWRKLSGIFLDKITGPQYEATLQSLKEVIEK